MDEEHYAMILNGIWNLIELPPNVKPIKTKVDLSKKNEVNGIRCKARLVARGFVQSDSKTVKHTHLVHQVVFVVCN